jgi:hypothetical protein
MWLLYGSHALAEIMPSVAKYPTIAAQTLYAPLNANHDATLLPFIALSSPLTFNLAPVFPEASRDEAPNIPIRAMAATAVS